MRCTQCAAVSYSAAARTMVERGDRCTQCGGELALAPEEPPVGVAADPRAPAEASVERGRRFER
jgi:hypothetical protein